MTPAPPVRGKTLFRPVGAALLMASVGACSPPTEESPSLVRPLDHPLTVDSPWSPAEKGDRFTGASTEALLRVDFESGIGDLHAYRSAQPFGDFATPPLKALPAPSAPRATPEAAAHGSQGLRFDTPSGAALWITPALADTAYSLTYQTRVQCEERREQAEQRGYVGQVLLLELHQLPDPEAHGGDAFAAVKAILETQLASKHLLTGPISNQFEERRLLFKSSVYTRAMALVFFAGDPGWWRSAEQPTADPPNGTVDLDDLLLRPVRLRDYLAFSHLSVQDDWRTLATANEESDPWVRKVKLDGEIRRAFLAPAPTRGSVHFQAPSGPFRLSLGIGVLEERVATWGTEPVEFQIQVLAPDGRLVLQSKRSLQPGRVEADLGWQEWNLEGTTDGGKHQLVLETRASASSRDLGVFAEPCWATQPKTPPRNLILVSLDTLRADRLGCYGYQREDGIPVSPHLDAFADQSRRFSRARTVASYTLPSHATMMTGLYPAVHAVVDSQRRLVDGVHDVLAQRLQRAGYETAAFTGGGFVSYEYGFHLGFDRYSTLDPLLSPTDPMRNAFPRPNDRAFNDASYARASLDAALEWMATRAESPFFLFLHSFLVHNYHPTVDREQRFVREDPLDFLATDRDLHHWDRELAKQDLAIPPELIGVLRDLYDATIHQADAEFGRLVAFLKEHQLWDRTVVLVTSDHGEEFGEHRGLLHGRTLYEEVMQIPLMLRVPGMRNAVIDAPVDLTQIAATLSELAGLATLENNGPLNLLQSEADLLAASQIWGEVTAPFLTERYSCTRDGWKLIFNPETAVEEPGYEKRRPPQYELYDLGSDPEEQSNLLAPPHHLEPPHPRAGKLRLWLDHRRQEFARESARRIPELHLLETTMSPDQVERLRELGYAVDE